MIDNDLPPLSPLFFGFILNTAEAKSISIQIENIIKYLTL